MPSLNKCSELLGARRCDTIRARKTYSEVLAYMVLYLETL